MEGSQQPLQIKGNMPTTASEKLKQCERNYSPQSTNGRLTTTKINGNMPATASETRTM
jgi:hypothetical protein